MGSKAIPRSKATNSYDLLKDVITAIREEPKRIHMEDFYTTSQEIHNLYNQSGPACGTVGCIAGWLGILARPAKTTVNERMDRAFSGWIRLLDVGADRNRLVYGSRPYPFPPSSLYGTKEYAKHVIQNIRKFMEKHKTALKAIKLDKNGNPR